MAFYSVRANWSLLYRTSTYDWIKTLEHDVPSTLDRDPSVPTRIGVAHTLRASDLPPIHRDPFDRILAAQAIEDGFHLLTHDKVPRRYSDWVLVV